MICIFLYLLFLTCRQYTEHVEEQDKAIPTETQEIEKEVESNEISLEETKNNIIKGNRINHKLGILMQQELLSFQQYDVDTLKEYVNKLYKKYTHTLKK